MSARMVPGYDTAADMSDWPGSPLSTLHSATATAQPIRREEYVRDSRYVIRFELPGIDPDADLDVSIGRHRGCQQAKRLNPCEATVFRVEGGSS